jgi:hypothetical protein
MPKQIDSCLPRHGIVLLRVFGIERVHDIPIT